MLTPAKRAHVRPRAGGSIQLVSLPQPFQIIKDHSVDRMRVGPTAGSSSLCRRRSELDKGQLSVPEETLGAEARAGKKPHHKECGFSSTGREYGST